jgi:hypothetical protein
VRSHNGVVRFGVAFAFGTAHSIVTGQPKDTTVIQTSVPRSPYSFPRAIIRNRIAPGRFWGVGVCSRRSILFAHSHLWRQVGRRLPASSSRA